MPFLTQGKTNWKYILILLILAVIVVSKILSIPLSFAVEQPTIKIPSPQRMPDIFNYLKFIFFIFLGFIPVLIFAFGINYLIVWGGFKLFNIKEISVSKTFVFIFLLIFLSGICLSGISVIGSLLEVPVSLYFLRLIGFLIFSLVIFFFIKHFLGISKKKLYYFSLYIIFLSLAFYLLQILVQH